VRALVVEDEGKPIQVLASALRCEHIEVEVSRTREDVFFAKVFDLALLDLMLPGRRGSRDHDGRRLS
jgi:DNA-binding response OmpR family regulator